MELVGPILAVEVVVLVVILMLPGLRRGLRGDDVAVDAGPRLTWLYWGNVLTYGSGLFLLFLLPLAMASSPRATTDFGSASSGEVAAFAAEVGIILALTVGAGANLWSTGGFRRGTTHGGAIRYFAYWVTAAPGIVILCASVVGVAALFVFTWAAAGIVEQEARVATVRRGVRDGVQDALGGDWR